MPIITTAGLDDSVRIQYESSYMKGAQFKRTYDQFAHPVEGGNMQELKRSTAVRIPFLSDLAPSQQTMSETVDLTPRTLSDTYVDISPTSLGNAIKVSEKFELTQFTETINYMELLGKNMEESVDFVAKTVALAGALVRRTAARASLDAGTATHRLTRARFMEANSILQSLKVPGFEVPNGQKWACLVHPWAMYDLGNDTTLTALGQYQQGEIILQNEIGSLHGFKIIVSPFAHVFYGAGVANATNIATTLAADANELATTVTVASGTSIAAGQRMLVGTKETGATLYPTNESVIVTNVNGTTITIAGEGANGGLRFAHAAGEAFTNTDNVIPALFGGPFSLAKIFDTEIGEYGQVVGPDVQGLAHQWKSMAWKWYGNYARAVESWIHRVEVSTALDA
jgi:N4-gp56 family major capsid protein